ncbi:SymE family type I addiction module toxin [Lonsdalea quercina]|uniref:SymE family type I addiction module toxin n=1 Tax=Lonsdalea quercina TaxID=71657 RepID=UPI003974FF4B
MHPRLLRLYRYSQSTSLNLRGYWLEAARFGTDTPVVITVEHGQLLIRIVAEGRIKKTGLFRGRVFSYFTITIF